MKIVYFTTAMSIQSFRQFSSRWNIALNPSNQNFHNKMIRSLAISNDVSVISIRPFSKRNCKIKKLQYEVEKEEKITWHYLEISKQKFNKISKCKKQTFSILKKMNLDDAVFITDTINPSVLTIANAAKDKFKKQTIGICTDSPSNISGTNKSYTLYLLNHASKLDGYIALTEGLDVLFNEERKPSIIIEGVVENNLPKKSENLYGKYVFFGGAMMEKYGIYNLIQAFKNLNLMDTTLLICGHHFNKSMLKATIGTAKNIQFLGIVSVKTVLELEQWSLVNVNPRPYSEDFDRYSIPSKTIEYLSSGVPTVSVKNTKLEKYFKDEIIWAKSSDPDDLSDALKEALKLSKEERTELGKRAREKVCELYSLTSVNKKLDEFLSQFVEQ